MQAIEVGEFAGGKQELQKNVAVFIIIHAKAMQKWDLL